MIRKMRTVVMIHLDHAREIGVRMSTATLLRQRSTTASRVAPATASQAQGRVGRYGRHATSTKLLVLKPPFATLQKSGFCALGTSESLLL
jgi:hypothetical protein